MPLGREERRKKNEEIREKVENALTHCFRYFLPAGASPPLKNLTVLFRSAYNPPCYAVPPYSKGGLGLEP